jgi:2-polyprenyl-3-methyl-5-hydroxy-6-metoxy-1,4-benzoquinol methylase
MPLSERDRAEVKRSAEEAREVVLQPVNPEHLARYMNPPADTPYPLQYAFHLLGDVRGKTVLDFGCGSGENIVPLTKRGAHVIGLDISPDLIDLARQRLAMAGLSADLRVASAYSTGLSDESVDVVFNIALIHHLAIDQVLPEMSRILAKRGEIILSEPIRFSRSYAYLRSLLAKQRNISEYEHPLTRTELASICAPFTSKEVRYFRLPFIPLLQRIGNDGNWYWKLDRWLLSHLPILTHYATAVVVCLTHSE